MSRGSSLRFLLRPEIRIHVAPLAKSDASVFKPEHVRIEALLYLEWGPRCEKWGRLDFLDLKTGCGGRDFAKIESNDFVIFDLIENRSHSFQSHLHASFYRCVPGNEPFSGMRSNCDRMSKLLLAILRSVICKAKFAAAVREQTPVRDLRAEEIIMPTDPTRTGQAEKNIHSTIVSLCALAFLSSLLFLGCRNEAASNVSHPELNSAALNVTPAPSNNAILPGMQASPLDSTNILRSFSARGVIRELPAGGETVLIRHEDIPGFMPRMTMEFNVRDTNQLRGLLVGHTITFRVKANEKESWIEDLHRTATNELASPIPAEPAPSSLLHAAQLKPGDLFPDAELLSENGHTVKLSDFRGQALAFTFLFTRCPLPDFCPRMNHHFNQARNMLLQNTEGPTNWQFLSISFDPEFDQPRVLTRYAYSYRGANPDRWLFAAAATHVTAFMASQLDFRFVNEGGSFVHNLRTVVLDPQRRVYRQFDGNKWKAEDLAQALAAAAQTSPTQ